MSTAVYRGVSYDIEKPKKDYIEWYQNTHSKNTKNNTYRGISYAPSKNKEVV